MCCNAAPKHHSPDHDVLAHKSGARASALGFAEPKSSIARAMSRRDTSGSRTEVFGRRGSAYPQKMCGPSASGSLTSGSGAVMSKSGYSFRRRLSRCARLTACSVETMYRSGSGSAASAGASRAHVRPMVRPHTATAELTVLARFTVE